MVLVASVGMHKFTYPLILKWVKPNQQTEANLSKTNYMAVKLTKDSFSPVLGLNSVNARQAFSLCRILLKLPRLNWNLLTQLPYLSGNTRDTGSTFAGINSSLS